MKSFLWALLMVIMMINTASCRSEPMLVTEKAIIFIPGYSGSALRNQSTGERIWLTVSEALWGSSTLALDKEGLEISGAMKLIEDGILRKVGVVPFLYAVDIYDSFIEKLESRFEGRSRIILFPYDWRQDNFKTVTKLDQLVDQLIDDGTRSISIIAHSMGGLVTTYYLRYGAQEPEMTSELPRETWSGAQQIDRVVLAGVPFRGTMARFRDMQEGAQYGLNKTLMAGQAMSSFPSSYQLLPFFESSKILSRDLQPIPDVIFNPEYWIKNRWGLLRSDEASPQAVENREQFTTRELERARQFLEWINRPSQEEGGLSTRLLHIVGKGRPTLAKVILLKDHEEGAGLLLFDEKDLGKYLPEISADFLFENGDGSVTLESASLPQVLTEKFPSVSSLETKIGHRDIFNDKKVWEQVFDFLSE